MIFDATQVFKLANRESGVYDKPHSLPRRLRTWKLTQNNDKNRMRIDFTLINKGLRNTVKLIFPYPSAYVPTDYSLLAAKITTGWKNPLGEKLTLNL